MNLTPEQMAQLWRVSPASFAHELSKGDFEPWLPAGHLQVLSNWIVDAVAGRKPRIIINMPPRHGKSELISKWTPVWFLENWPHKRVINTGHGSDFSEEWGAKARDLVKQHEGKLRFAIKQDSKARGRWNTTQGGGMVATGVCGQITGRGADLFIVDDPIKDHQQANSLTYRDEVWDWWRNTARTRLEPGAAVIILMTRWHEDDLVGRLLAAAADGTGEHWDVLNLPAIAGQEDGIGRKPGTALWPQRWPIQALQAIQLGTSQEAWEAQYQGVPANLVANGNVYKSFDDAMNVAPVRFDPQRPLVWSMDFNVDPMCSTLCQWTEEPDHYTFLTNEFKKTISVLQELCMPDFSTQELCDEFCNRADRYRIAAGGRLNVRMYGDRSGNSRHTVGSTDYTIIKDFFKGKPGYSVTTHIGNSNPAVKDRVNAVNAMLCNALGQRRTLIDPSCKELIRDFKEVKWKRDSGGNTTGQIDKSDGKRTHVSDAYGYFVEKEFGLRSQAGGMKGLLQ